MTAPMLQGQAGRDEGQLYCAAFLEWNPRTKTWDSGLHYIGGCFGPANAKASFWTAYQGKKVKLCAIAPAVGATVAKKSIVL